MMLEWYDQIQRDTRLAGREVHGRATFTVVLLVCLALGVAATAGVLFKLHPGCGC